MLLVKGKKPGFGRVFLCLPSVHHCTWRAGLNGYVQPHIHIAAGGIGLHQRFGRSNEVMLFVKGKKTGFGLMPVS